MDDSGEPRLAPRHVAELGDFFAAHDRWLFGHACVRTRGDRELAADLVQDTFEAAARAGPLLPVRPGRRKPARREPGHRKGSRVMTGGAGPRQDHEDLLVADF